MSLLILRRASTTLRIDGDTLVDDILRAFPQTARVFLDNGMKCVGCPIGLFHTIDDACREHDLDRAMLLSELDAAVTQA